MNKIQKIYVAGHRGMVGSAIVRKLQTDGFNNIVVRVHADLGHAVASALGYSGKIKFDTSKPDGTPRKLMDSSQFSALGWKPHVSLESGLKKTYEDFKANTDLLRME